MQAVDFAKDDGRKPRSVILDEGKGVAGFCGSDHQVALLTAWLRERAYFEEIRESLLVEQFGLGALGGWVRAEVVWAFFQHQDDADKRALLTHVVSASDPSLRDRRPQVHIWKPGRSGDIDYTVEATDLTVSRLS